MTQVCTICLCFINMHRCYDITGLVPRIQFEDLDVMSTGSGMAQSFSNMSLSGALLTDGLGLRASMNNNGTILICHAVCAEYATSPENPDGFYCPIYSLCSAVFLGL